MKKYLSIILSVLLAVQPAFGAFEGVKKKAVSAKEAVARSRVALKENEQCLKSGTGPNCTKAQRSALRIIHNFVIGKWVQARAGLKEFYGEHRTAVQMSAVMTGSLLAVFAIVAAFIGGLEIMDVKKGKDFAKIVQPENAVDVQKMFEMHVWDEDVGTDSLTSNEFINLIYALMGDTSMSMGGDPLNHYRIFGILERNVRRMDRIMGQLGWNTKFSGKNLIEMVNDNKFVREAEKGWLISHFKEKGVRE